MGDGGSAGRTARASVKNGDGGPGKKHWSVRIIYRLEPGRKTGLERRAKDAAKMAVSVEKKGRAGTASPGGVRFVAIKKIAWC